VTILFRVRRWLDEDEFKELLNIADYLGYENNEKVFRLNIDKAYRNGYFPADVKSLLSKYASNYNEISKSLEKLLDTYKPVFEWVQSRGVVRVTLLKQVYWAIKEQLKRYNARYGGSLDDRVFVEIMPYQAFEVYRILKELFIEVEDPENLFSEKSLMFKPELKDVELRPYQVEALKNWVENGYRGIIALPTGSGKSIIAIAGIVKTAVRTLIIAYTKEHVLQWRNFILKYTNIPPHMVGVFYSEEKRLAPITITTYQSGFRNIGLLSPYFTMLIVDEVHHLPAEKFRYIALHSLATYRMGLSATPIREDGKHEELFPLLGGIVYYKSPSELVEMGYLAPYRVVTVKVRLTPQEEKVYRELRRKYKELVGDKKFEEVLELARRGDPRAIEALKIHGEMRALLARSTSKIEKAVELAKSEFEKGGKVIIFTQYVDQAVELAKRLGALLITGETPDDVRRRALDEFKSSKRGILVVTTVGDEGIDIPDANVGIIVSGTGSRRQFIQRLGRLLRPKPDRSEAVLYEIILEKTAEEYQAAKRKRVELEEFFKEDLE
jgi:superfamily II DNA or RNA helicase